MVRTTDRKFSQFLTAAGNRQTKNPHEPDEISTILNGSGRILNLVMRGAFVVQVWKASQGSAGTMEGLVEVVDTGNQFHFRSEAELIEYLRNRFAETSRNEPGKEGTK